MKDQDQALLRPERFAHANLFVADVDESVMFYRDVCGIAEIFREPGIKAGFLSNGATHHDVGLMQVSTRPLVGRDGTVQNRMAKGHEPGLNHLAFQVGAETALIAAYRSAPVLGVEIDKALDHGMSRSLYLLDPDGISIEFYADTVPDWRSFYAQHQNELISSRWNPDTEPAAPPIDPPARIDNRVPQAPFGTIEICGATLIVSDLEASLRFYEDVAGLTPVSASADSVLLGVGPDCAPCLALAGLPEPAGLDSIWFLADPHSPGLNGIGRRLVYDPNGLKILFFGGETHLPGGHDRDFRARALAA